MILAAGRGARMRPLTDTCPKPLLDAGGRPLIDYHLAALRDAGIHEVVVNLAWHGDQLREHIGDGAAWGLAVRFSDEGDAALETGGGIRRALPLLGRSPFLVVNGDVWIRYRFDELRAALETGNDLAHLLMVPRPAWREQGDFGLRGDRVTASPPSFVFSGIGVYSPALFDGTGEGAFALAPLLRDAIRAGRAGGRLFRGDWRDIGTPDRLDALRRDLAAARGR